MRKLDESLEVRDGGEGVVLGEWKTSATHHFKSSGQKHGRTIVVRNRVASRPDAKAFSSLISGVPFSARVHQSRSGNQARAMPGTRWKQYPHLRTHSRRCSGTKPRCRFDQIDRPPLIGGWASLLSTLKD